jgi:ankyrin repeat protein
VEAGADINAPFEGLHTESPLHWAASSDDVDVLDALIKAGADIEASGGIIGGGTPLADAVGFGQWQAARRLVEHGSRTLLWQAAALGLTDRIEEHFAVGTPSPEEVTNAFWHACSARQGGAAELLLEHGADLNWIGWDRVTPLDAAHSNGAGEVIEWLNSKGARRAAELS